MTSWRLARRGRGGALRLLPMLLLMLAGCTTVTGYARHYQQLGDATGPGVLPANALTEQLRATEAERALVVGDVETARALGRCRYLRNQLLVASEKARREFGQDAAEVTRAAARLEGAYQHSDEAFAAACHEILATPLGKTFAKEIPPLDG